MICPAGSRLGPCARLRTCAAYFTIVNLSETGAERPPAAFEARISNV